MDFKQVYKKAYKISFWVHSSIILVLIVASVIGDLSCVSKKPNDVLEVEFTVDVSTDQEATEEQVEDLIKEPEPIPIDEPKPEPDPEPEPILEPEKRKPEKPKRKPIKVSNKVVVINQPKVNTPQPKQSVKPKSSPQKQQSDLTPEEIKKLLDMGAKPSDQTSVPGERERCLAIVKNKLYDAWRKPSLPPTEVVRAAVLTIHLGENGYITKYKLTRSSGNRELDASVESAAKAVRRIPGLTSSFIKEYKTITIEFNLE